MVKIQRNITLQLLIILSLLCLASNCSKDKIFKDDVLSIPKLPYNGNQLRIDGYYYEIGVDGYLYPEYFFYSNGSLIYIGGRYSPNTIDTELEYFIKSPNYIDDAKNDKLSGGLFIIDGVSIKFEKWYPSSGGGLPAYIRSGVILNDTTFLISKSVRSKTGEEKELNETYHFKQFSPKPDSTNVFIP